MYRLYGCKHIPLTASTPSGTSTRSTTNLVALAAGLLLVGCTAESGDSRAVADEGIDHAAQLSSVAPASCADIAAADLAAGDGDYTLYVDRDPARPWLAHCVDMAGTPREYLSLQNTGVDANFSQYTAGGASPGSDVRTRYTRVRIDPVSLQVDIADQAFAATTGSLTHSGGEPVNFMPFGVAMSCDSSPSGLGNIDLTGTPFAIGTTFCQGGHNGMGSAVLSAGDQIADLSGGGFCGFTAPNPCPYNPFNGSGGTYLSLVYSAGPPSTCGDIRAIDPAAADGDYTLFVDSDSARPWVAYCHDMAGAPREYLSLANTGVDANFSQYTAGGASPGSDVRTRYTRVRLDPSTLHVDIADQTFAATTGSLTHSGGEPVNFMPFGVAMSCDSSPSGVANIDLTGTPFAIASSFCQGGASGVGSVALSDGDQVADLSGGGYCGFSAPNPCPYNPFNGSGGTYLSVAYAPPLPETCADIQITEPWAGDDDYTLYLDGNINKPWTAYCHDMAGTAREYVTLHNTGTGANFAQYTAGGASLGTDVRTSYTRIRINPLDLTVDIADQTFATTTGSLIHSGSEQVDFMPFGVAMSCDSSPSGLANIDLTGTELAIASTFCQGGASSVGNAALSADDQIADLTGGGYCGFTAPDPCPYNPFNGSGGTHLALELLPFQAPQSFLDNDLMLQNVMHSDQRLHVGHNGDGKLYAEWGDDEAYQWTLEPSGVLGYYYLRNQLHTNQRLHVGHNGDSKLYAEWGSDDAYRWRLEPTDGGAFYLRNRMHDNQRLHVGHDGNGQLYAEWGSDDAYRWLVEFAP